MDATAITDVADLPTDGTFLFTVTEPGGYEEEVILTRLGDAAGDADDVTLDDAADDADDVTTGEAPRVAAWKNYCTHEPDQRLDRGGEVGAATRDGEVICPRHGSLFDLATGACGNGPARNQSLVGVDVTVRDGTVYLTDDGVTFEHVGGIDDDDTPSSTTHMGF